MLDYLEAASLTKVVGSYVTYYDAFATVTTMRVSALALRNDCRQAVEVGRLSST